MRLKGVVTVLSGWKNSFFFQDRTSGLSVDRLDQAPELHAGDKIVIEGKTAPGSFAPIVLSESVRVLGKARLPKATRYKAADLLGGAEDSQWLSLHGNVRAAEIKPIWGRSVLTLNLDIGKDFIVEVHVHDFSPGTVRQLAGATVTVRGVCGTIFNDRRQFLGLRLFASSLDDVTVEKPPPPNPFDVPARPLGELFQFSDSVNVVDQVKVTGLVSWSKAREGFYLQDGSKAAFIESSDPSEVRVGSAVEVVGYPANRRGVPLLRASFVRALEARQPLASSPRSAADMIVLRDGFLSTPYDAQLVTLQGRLVDQVSGATTHTLLLQEGNQVFSAILPNSPASAALEMGSFLRVTGICSVSLDETREASSFELLLRDPADIKVLRRPPWWNGSRVVGLLGAAVVVLSGIVVWSVTARRRAGLKTLVVTDPLTSLYNRRGFELLAQKQREIAKRRRTDMLLFYLDINRFKEINDQFGHRQGDRALQHVASALQEVFRESDILGRLGGDEFAVMAIDAPASSEEVLLRRLKEELEKINHAADQPFAISISTGVVVCRHGEAERTLEDLLESADSLMYAQKRERNDRSQSVAFA